MNAEVQGNNTWGKFSAFRVLGDHEPMPGFRLVMQFAPRAEAVARLLEVRARQTDPLDSELARLTVRAGIGLLQSHNVSFAYANAEEVVALIRPDAVARMGSSLAVYEQLLSMYSARLAVLLGEDDEFTIAVPAERGQGRRRLRTARDGPDTRGRRCRLCAGDRRPGGEERDAPHPTCRIHQPLRSLHVTQVMAPSLKNGASAARVGT